MSDPTTLTPSPILDDKAATHAILRANEGEPQTCSTVCDLDVAGSLSLPDFTGGWATVDDLAGAIAAGVNCLICLGWLGARHTTPPVIIKGSWFPHTPPSLPGEGDAFTDRLTGASAAKYLSEHGIEDPDARFAGDLPAEITIPYDHRRNRQCSINYHDECSDPSGYRCECPCHRQKPGTMIEVEGGQIIIMPPEQPTDALISKIMDDVLDELMRARDKFPGQHLPLGFGPAPWWPVVTLRHPGVSAGEVRDALRAMTDAAADGGTLTWRHVIAEEGAEALAEDENAKARAELAQLAAMAIRAMLDIDDPQPVHYTGPSGVVWDQVGTDADGDPILAADVKQPLTPGGAVDPASTDAMESRDA